jgi:hypothetical protein
VLDNSFDIQLFFSKRNPFLINSLTPTSQKDIKGRLSNTGVMNHRVSEVTFKIKGNAL